MTNETNAESRKRVGLRMRIGQLAEAVRRGWQTIAPGPRAWQGATLGIALAALLVWLVEVADGVGTPPGILGWGLGILLGVLPAALIGGLIVLLGRLLRGIPWFYGWAAIAAVLLIGLPFLSSRAAIGTLLTVLTIIGCASLLGAAGWILARGGWRMLPRARRRVVTGALGIGLLGIVGGGVLLSGGGAPISWDPETMAPGVHSLAALPDPSQPGTFLVRTAFYGSGEDRHRPEYGAGVTWKTEPVDGSLLVEGWSALRTAYWGFDAQAMPRNGRVWYPEGVGPFPLVLIVHGNHQMEEFSDPGYAYLGELLASRGFIAVSVDENFLNSSFGADLLMVAGLKKENDARGWLLLEHLRQWRVWNDEARHPLYRKIDLDRIALIGHSRGGEAVAVAAAFNRLSRYPDNARLAFDYGFEIRSVIAIAPVDGQYQPRKESMELSDINYLTVHGAYDADVIGFMGANQYERVTFSGEPFCFKAALYIDQANHGQFNTVWGGKDVVGPAFWLLNRKGLMPAETQQQIARVYFSAFLEATLQGRTEYLPLFRDARAGAVWLPRIRTLTLYEDSATRALGTFDEDADPGTATLSGGRITAQGLTIWREQPVERRLLSGDTQAVTLGWDNATAEVAASYMLTLPAASDAASSDDVLVLALADANLSPDPKAVADWKRRRAADPSPIDLTVEVVDRAGQGAQLPLSHFASLPLQFESQVAGMRFWDPLPAGELIFRTFEFPLADFQQANPKFDPAGLATIRLIFDRTPAGVVVLDNVGLRPGED